MGAQAHQTELLCPNCGSQSRYDPAQAALVCNSCGTPRRIEVTGDASVEAPYDPDAPSAENPASQGEETHNCQTCGGDVVFAGPQLSARCPYCDGPVVLAAEGAAFETMALLPFRVPLEDAVGFVSNWTRGRIAAPSDLAGIVEAGRLAALYAPFWTFDSREAVEYWATYTTGSGKRRRRRKMHGRMTILFDDLLVPASPHVTPLIRDGVLHDFDPRRLRPYDAAYLAGFAAERHHQSVAEGLAANAADKDLLIRNRIRIHTGKPGTKVTRYRTDTSGIHYRRILLPVWILHYRYGGRAKKIVVSGIDGRCFGERPFSLPKLAGYAALASAALMALGLVWGALAAA